MKRIDYIDALRGLSMILVVLAHVFLMMSPRHWDSSPIASVLMSFRMPLFFFVSGFFAYRAVEKWTASTAIDVAVRKFRAQIICSLVFFCLFQWMKNLPMSEMWERGLTYFWFTVALFQMWLLYLGLALASRKSGKNLLDIPILIMICCSVAFGQYQTSLTAWRLLSWHCVIYYFQFFAIGLMARRHAAGFDRLVDNTTFRTAVIILFFTGCIYFYSNRYHTPTDFGTFFLQEVLHRYCGLFSVFLLFRSSSAYFEGNAFPSRALKYIGQRTLDIYMLHMFFMPSMTSMASVFAPTSMALPKLVFGLAVALCDIALCLVVSRVIRCSPFLEVWLFGVRPRPRYGAEKESLPSEAISLSVSGRAAEEDTKEEQSAVPATVESENADR